MIRDALLVAAGVAIVSATVRADVVTEWNEVALDAIRVDRTAPPRSARALAMVHIAIYDAVNGVLRTNESYLVPPGAPAGTSAEAAAIAAAHTVLVALFPGQTVVLDEARSSSLATIPVSTARDDGIEWGQTVGTSVLAARDQDGSALMVPYSPGTNPGEWIPTPPGFGPAALPQWPYLTPFALTSASQFRPQGPPRLDSAEYAAAFDEVKVLGGAASTTRTPEQSEIALFWVNGPGTATPPGHWNSIAQRIAEQEGNTLAENARLFALLNIAEADAAIAAWDCKYAYDDWRPVTAIRAADTDGNPQTQPDPEWSSFIPTPPFPDYISGHSTFSAAAAAVLAGFYGTDEIAFEINSDAMPDTIRSFECFWQAAEESGRSRIYGGIHWEHSNADGLECGRKIGKHAAANVLKPIQTAPAGPRICGTLNLGIFLAMLLLVALRIGPRKG